MATIKTPVRAEYTGSDVTGLSEYQTNEVISVENGGTGVEAVSTNAISSTMSVPATAESDPSAAALAIALG